MIPKIFEIDTITQTVIINENILSIPELRAVYDYYSDDEMTRHNAFQFLRHMHDPYGPYNNLSEQDKEDSILHDFPGDYSTEDEVIQDASKKLKTFYMSPIYKYYLDNKELLYNLGDFARTAVPTDGKNGNLADLLNQLKSVGKAIIEFGILEKQAEKELDKMKLRGNRHTAYDEFDDEDD